MNERHRSEISVLLGCSDKQGRENYEMDIMSVCRRQTAMRGDGVWENAYSVCAEQEEEKLSDVDMDFNMEDVLQFSNEDIGGPIGDAISVQTNDSHTCASSTTFSVSDEYFDELEWLSTWVENEYQLSEQGTTDSLLQKEQITATESHSNSNSVATRETTSSSSSSSSSCRMGCPNLGGRPARARSKRSRAPASNLLSRIIPPPLTAKPSAVHSISNECCEETAAVPAKRTYKKKYENGNGEGEKRKCSHCETTKTPQWRTGPKGPKTLCNACGVRFKSGRLVPEYRPASSPSFMPSLHSNSHRKVLQLRRLNHLRNITTSTNQHQRQRNEDKDDDEQEEAGHCSWFGFSDFDGCLTTPNTNSLESL